MKRTHALAFELDDFDCLPLDIQLSIFSYLSLSDLFPLATVCKRLKHVSYNLPQWKSFEMQGFQNHSAILFSRAHGRKIESLTVKAMRLTRGLLNTFLGYKHLEYLDITNIWKSPAVNNRFVNILVQLRLKTLLFGPNEITEKGFLSLCKGLKNTLETLDFNSRFMQTKGFYSIVHLQKLKSLTFRSCIHLDHTVIPFICALGNLCTLQLSFLPLVSAACLDTLNKSHLKDQLKTLVLNGMWLNEEHCKLLSKFQSLEFLSLCHPQISNKALCCFQSNTLSVFTLFCSRTLHNVDFLKGLPQLQNLCIYRCRVNVNSLISWAQRRKKLHIDTCKISLTLDGIKQMKALPNVSLLQVSQRPFRISI